MKAEWSGYGYYTGPAVDGFFYGVADRAVDPYAGADRLLAARGFGAVARAQQVHGDVVVTARDAATAACAADAITVAPGQAAVIRVADCVPILLLHPGRRRAAAVHAGWRGTYASIAEKALALLGDPAGTVAYVGPAIGVCCYEVSDELADKFTARFGAGAWLRREGARPHLDLPALNAGLLRRAGAGQVVVEERCTRDAPDLHSFRRDGEAAGRLAAFVAVEP